MANLEITFGRHVNTPGAPVLDGSKSRKFVLEIAETSDGDTVSTFSAAAGENIIRIVAGAACYVDIGAAPEVVLPNSSTGTRGFYIGSAQTLELAVEQGEKVAVIAAS